jgi:membrane protease YdiL (CAAX protease family)
MVAYSRPKPAGRRYCHLSFSAFLLGNRLCSCHSREAIAENDGRRKGSMTGSAGNRPDYTNYTIDQLENELRTVDDEKDRLTFRALVKEIKRRPRSKVIDPQRNFFWPRIPDARTAVLMAYARCNVSWALAVLVFITGIVARAGSETASKGLWSALLYCALAICFQRMSRFVLVILAFFFFSWGWGAVRGLSPVYFFMFFLTLWFFTNGVRAVLAYRRIREAACPATDLWTRTGQVLKGSLPMRVFLHSLASHAFGVDGSGDAAEGTPPRRRWLMVMPDAESPGRLMIAISCVILLSALTVCCMIPLYGTYLAHRPWLLAPLAFALTWGLEVVSIVLALWAWRRPGRWPLPVSLALSAPGDKMVSVLKGLAIIVVILVPTALLVKHGFGVAVESSRFPHLMSAPSGLYPALMAVSMFTLAPVAEEVFFRGLLYNALRSRLTIPVAAGLQALLFAVVHQEIPFLAFSIFVIGFAAAILYEKTKSLVTPILLHVTWNGLVTVPLLFLILQNSYVPAATWAEAREAPAWLAQGEVVKRQQDGKHQLQYAKDTWGLKGTKEWKKAVNGLSAVCFHFSEDRPACAEAHREMASVYYEYLGDYRRAVAESDRVLSRYAEQKPQCAEALRLKAWACFHLKDFGRARESFEKIVEEFPEYRDAVASAKRGIEYLNALQGAGQKETSQEGGFRKDTLYEKAAFLYAS